MLDGSVEWQHLLFTIHALLAIFYILAIRIKVTSVLLWIFQISLITRNVHVSAGFDDYMSCLLLISFFLKVDRYFTWVDFKRKSLIPKKEKTDFHWTNVLFIAQVFSIHFVAGWIKDGQSWVEDFNALTIIYNNEHISSSIGLFLGDYPDLLTKMTPWVRWLEVTVPFTLFIPRLRVVMLFFMLFLHLGIIITINAYLFPFVNLITLLPMLPSIFYDKVFSLFKGKNFRPLQKKMAQKSTFGIHRPSVFQQSFVAVLLVLMSIQVVKFGTRKEELPGVPRLVHKIAMSTLFYQRWLLFGPDPYQKDGYFVFEGENENGEIFEAMGNNKVLKDKKPGPAHQFFKNRRWSRFLLDPTVITTPALHLQTARGFCQILGKKRLSSITVKFRELSYDPLNHTKSLDEKLLSRADCHLNSERFSYGQY